MKERKYEGKDFIVTIDRNKLQRRYVLSTIEEDGAWTEKNDPLFKEDFETHYGFSPDWPHKKTKP